MEESLFNDLVICFAIEILFVLWYFYLEFRIRRDIRARAVTASEQETPTEPNAETRLQSYEEVDRNRPGLRHRNSRDINLTTDDVSNNSIDTVQSNSEQASGSQNESGENSKNSNDDNSAKEDRSGVSYISKNESTCMYGVCGDIENIVKYNDESINDAGGDSNLDKSRCETCDGQESIRDIGNDESGSRAQDYSKDINVIENLSECNNESKDGDKTEDICKKLDNKDNDKYVQEYDAGGESNSGKDMHETCEGEVISKANSEIESVGQCCSADDISINSKYDTASGGNEVTKE